MTRARDNADHYAGLGASNPTVTLGSNATFPTGHIVQVKHFVNTYYRAYSYAADPLSHYELISGSDASGVDWEVDITPSDNSHKILMMVNLSMFAYANGQAESRSNINTYEKIGSGGYSEIESMNEILGVWDYNGSNMWASRYISFNLYRNPTTLLSCKYKFAQEITSSGVNGGHNNGAYSYVTLMEVVA